MARTLRPAREAARRAQEAHDAAYAQDGSDTTDTTQEPQGQEPQGQEPQGQEPQGQEPQEPQGQEPQGEEPEGENVWKQRYNSLKGKYDKEIPSMAAQIRDLEQQLADRDQTIESLRSAPQQNSTTEEKKTLATPEELEEYGEDFVTFVQRIADTAAQRHTERLTPRIEEIRGEVSKSGQQAAQNRVYTFLDNNVPIWRERNRDPGFLGWLNDMDPMSGQPRKQLLLQAFEAGEAQRVANIFQAYGPVEKQPDQSTSSKVPLDQLAGPQRPAPAGQPQETPKPETWSRADIEKFYTDVQKGKIKGEEKDKKERDLASAMADGRIS